jgi:hypothetical protein
MSFSISLSFSISFSFSLFLSRMFFSLINLMRVCVFACVEELQPTDAANKQMERKKMMMTWAEKNHVHTSIHNAMYIFDKCAIEKKLMFFIEINKFSRTVMKAVAW